MKLLMKQIVFFVCGSLFLMGTNISALSVEHEAVLEKLVVSQMIDSSSNVVDFFGYLMSFFGAQESSPEIDEIKTELKNTQEKVKLLTESNALLTQKNVVLKDENQVLVNKLQLEHDKFQSVIEELLDSYNAMIEQRDDLKNNLELSCGQLDKKIKYINQQYESFLQVIADLEME